MGLLFLERTLKMEKVFKVFFWLCIISGIIFGANGSGKWWIPFAAYAGFVILMVIIVFALSSAENHLFKAKKN